MSKPNTVDYANSGDYPTDPDVINYNYNTATYNEPRPIDSNYTLTNYDITNYPKTDYNKFNANLTNYTENNYKYAEGTVPINIICQSPDMLYQVPRDPQYEAPSKYMCFNNDNKLIEISKNGNHWTGVDLTKSNKHVKWQGSQCKINTYKCTKNNLFEDCEATWYVSPNDAFVIKYKENIWRRPDLEKTSGACSMTAISEKTAQNDFCKCDNVLERSNLKTKANMDENRTGKFWCAS
jgi:hypothetical protein